MAPRSWSQIPPDLIVAIASCLTAYIDYIRLRVVCVSWNNALPRFPKHLLSQIPWLIVPFDENKDCTESKQCFLSLTDKMYHIVKLPECRRKRFCGSSLGWLLMMEKSPAVNIFNPLTRTIIPLPPLSTFSNLEFRPSKIGKEFKMSDSTGCSHDQSFTVIQNYFIRKMILSSSPSTNNDFIVVVILWFKEMAFVKKGGQVWTLLKNPKFNYEYEDVIFYKGRCLGLDTSRRVIACDFDGPTPRFSVISRAPPEALGDTLYLVDCSGDLLLVSRIRREDFKTFVYHTEKFSVFKLNQSEPKWSWQQIEDIGDNVLFLGQNSSVSRLAHEFSGCQRNCIYFADDYHGWNFIPDDHHNWHYISKDDYSDNLNNKIGGYDFGVFDLRDGSTRALPYNPFNNLLIWPPPIWLTPNLN